MTDNTQPTAPETTSTGLVPKVVHYAINAADRGQSTVIAVLQDARTELRIALDGGIEYAEKLATGALRFSRNLLERADETSKHALASAERALTTVVTRARETTRAAEEQATGAQRSQAS